MIVAVDLDGTLAQYNGWRGPYAIGAPMPGAREQLEALIKGGAVLCLWTTRPTYVAEQWLERHGLRQLFSYVNASPYPSDDRKCSFDVLIDDVAVPFDTWEGMAERVLARGSRDTFFRDTLWSDRDPSLMFRGTGMLYVDMFDKVTDEVWRNHTPQGRTALLTICSHAKPYSKSYIHGRIREEIYGAGLHSVDYIHISNAGIIPHTSSLDELVTAYDWDGSSIEKEAVKTYLRAATVNRLHNWTVDHYERLGYTRCVVYLRESGNTLKAAKEALGHFATFVEAVEGYHMPWLQHADPDDCLLDPTNLRQLIGAL